LVGPRFGESFLNFLARYWAVGLLTMPLNKGSELSRWLNFWVWVVILSIPPFFLDISLDA